jgi:hypothetical protein
MLLWVLAEVVLGVVLVMLMMSDTFVFTEFSASILKPNLKKIIFLMRFHCLVVDMTRRWR